MALEMERDRDKPEWLPCIYREMAGERRICTNGYAINQNELVRPSKEIIRKMRSLKLALNEFGELPYSGICRSCTYRQP